MNSTNTSQCLLCVSIVTYYKRINMKTVPSCSLIKMQYWKHTDKNYSKGIYIKNIIHRMEKTGEKIKITQFWKVEGNRWETSAAKDRDRPELHLQSHNQHRLLQEWRKRGWFWNWQPGWNLSEKHLDLWCLLPLTAACPSSPP